MSKVPTPLPLLCSCPVSAQVSSRRTQSNHTEPFTQVVAEGGGGGNGNILRSLSPAGGSCQVTGTGSTE